MNRTIIAVILAAALGFLAGVTVAKAAALRSASVPARASQEATRPSETVAGFASEQDQGRTGAPLLAVTQPPNVSGEVGLNKAQLTGGGAPTPSLVRAGLASWFCNFDVHRQPQSPCTAGYPDTYGTDLYAAAGPQLRVGRSVTVFGPAGYAAVTLIDSCLCGGGRVLDAYADVFELVCGPVSLGTCEVAVRP